MATIVHRTDRGSRLRRAALVVLAVGQVVSGLASSVLGNSFTTPDRAGEPPIVPAGWAFSIWGLVEILSLGWALWAVHTREDGGELRDRLAVPLIVVFAGFSVWLAAAEIEPIWTTLAVFVVMIVGLLRALAIALEGQDEIARWSPLGRGLLWGLLGVYTGWSSIAIWINLTTAFAGSGAPVTGPVGVLAQLAVLAGAVATAVAILRRTHGLLPYAAAVAWAFVGAAVGAAGAGEPVLAAAAGVGLVAVVAATVITRRSTTAPRPARGVSPR